MRMMLGVYFIGIAMSLPVYQKPLFEDTEPGVRAPNQQENLYATRLAGMKPQWSNIDTFYREALGKNTDGTTVWGSENSKRPVANLRVTVFKGPPADDMIERVEAAKARNTYYSFPENK